MINEIKHLVHSWFFLVFYLLYCSFRLYGTFAQLSPALVSFKSAISGLRSISVF
jgi:hypothetical protein